MEYFELPPSYQKRIHADMSDDEITTIEIELYNLAIISRYDFTFDNERTKWARIYNNEIFRSARGLTSEMLTEIVRRGIHKFEDEVPENATVPEDVLLEALNNATPSTFMRSNDPSYFVAKRPDMLTPSVQVAIAALHPSFMNKNSKDECVKNFNFTDEMVETATRKFFKKLKILVDNKKLNYVDISPLLKPNEEEWKILWRCYYPGSSFIEEQINTRPDGVVPQWIRDNLITYSEDNIFYFKSVTEDEMLLFIDTHLKNSNKWTDSMNRIVTNLGESFPTVYEKVLLKEGWLIEYDKRQKSQSCWNAVTCDPHNIQFVRKPSDKLRIHALELDPTTIQHIQKTKAVCKFLGESFNKKASLKYPEDFYFCQLKPDLADESNLYRSLVVSGKDMERFLSCTYTMSFGNLDDDETHLVCDDVTFNPISAEELAVLEKFGCTGVMAGYISIKNFDND